MSTSVANVSRNSRAERPTPLSSPCLADHGGRPLVSFLARRIRFWTRGLIVTSVSGFPSLLAHEGTCLPHPIQSRVQATALRLWGVRKTASCASGMNNDSLLFLG